MCLEQMMYHAVPRGTVVLQGTTLCGATLRLPEVKSCRTIWCIIQREHIVENRCDFLGFKYAIYTEQELLNISLCILQRYCALFKPKYSPEK